MKTRNADGSRGKKIATGTRGTLWALEAYRRALHGLPAEPPVIGGYSLESLSSTPCHEGDDDK